MKKLACLHAHHSNIAYIEKAFASFEVELLHFVDPILPMRMQEGELETNYIQSKMRNQLQWIAESKVDAILITCTYFITFLQDMHVPIEIPILKIDEPFFKVICNVQEPQTILFTNPGTVPGTVERLKQYAQQRQKSIDIQIIIVEDTFALIMQGRKEEYDDRVSQCIYRMLKDGNQVISVAQLSMVDAARKVENRVNRVIVNPLDALVEYSVDQLNLRKRNEGSNE
ncbi:aspartate/glutamate racemase family protein [Bacillus sp. NPDC094106]|uniref:aspartate/glutamate racemase family protein n=1 Tax=Bacillus sp. NPDC094106 TaxID=3363949 RepID=UPI003811DD02